MTHERRQTGTGWPDPTGNAVRPVPAGQPTPPGDATRPADLVRPADPTPPGDVVSSADVVSPGDAEPHGDRPAAASGADGPGDGGGPHEASAEQPARARRLTSAGAMIVVLLALLGFTLVVQLKSNSTDSNLTTARQDDLVRILSDLDASEKRLRQEIAGLEDSQRQLTSGAQGRQAALDEATRRGDELGILAGTLPARGPGLSVRFAAAAKPIKASAILDAVQELRGAGAEAMQISGSDRRPVRIIASTFFIDADGGINVGGQRLTGPYTIVVIGEPQTMRTALNIPGGVVASVSGDGGNVAVQDREVVDVWALSEPPDLRYARPVS